VDLGVHGGVVAEESFERDEAAQQLELDHVGELLGEERVARELSPNPPITPSKPI